MLVSWSGLLAGTAINAVAHYVIDCREPLKRSVYRMLGWGLIPLGALTGVLVADIFALRASYPIVGAL